MSLSKRSQPTTSSPPPQVIAPTVTHDAEETIPVITETPKNSDIEIKAPVGVTPAVPLGELKETIAAQQPADVSYASSSMPSKLAEVSVVSIQLVALIVIIIGFVPPLLWQNTFLQVLGILCIGIALFIAIWAIISFKQKMNILPTPNAQGFLVTSGPYAFIRHPLYFSLLIGSVGLSLAYPTILRITALIILAIVLYIKIGFEERMLKQKFNGYEKYKKYTGALLPQLHNKKQEIAALTDNDTNNTTTA